MDLRLKDLREDHDLKQRDVAEYLHCSQTVYSRYESDRSQPSLETMARLAKFYNTSVDYLMRLTDNPKAYK